MSAYINREPVKVVAEILKSEMSLDDSHILLGDEKWDIPADKELFVVLFDNGPKPISRSSRFDTATNEEIQQATMLHEIRIEICSFGPSARTRKEEVAMALGSIFAQQTMEKYQCQVARMPGPAVNASDTEATARLLRFTTTVNVTALHTKVKGVDYYDKFNVRGIYTDVVNPPEVTSNA